MGMNKLKTFLLVTMDTGCPNKGKDRLDNR